MIRKTLFLTIITFSFLFPTQLFADGDSCEPPDIQTDENILEATEFCFWDTFQYANYDQKKNAVTFLKNSLNESSVLALPKSIIHARIGWLHTWEVTEYGTFHPHVDSNSAASRSAKKHLANLAYEHFVTSFLTNKSNQLDTLSIDGKTKYGLPNSRWEHAEISDNYLWNYNNPQLFNAVVEGFVVGKNSVTKNGYTIPSINTSRSDTTAFFNATTPTLLSVNKNTLGDANLKELKGYITDMWSLFVLCSKFVKEDMNHPTTPGVARYGEILTYANNNPKEYVYPSTPVTNLWADKSEAHFPTGDIIKTLCYDTGTTPFLKNANVPHVFENNFLILGDTIALYKMLASSTPNLLASTKIYEQAKTGNNYHSWENLYGQIKKRTGLLIRNEYSDLKKAIIDPNYEYRNGTVDFPHCMSCHQDS